MKLKLGRYKKIFNTETLEIYGVLLLKDGSMGMVDFNSENRRASGHRHFHSQEEI